MSQNIAKVIKKHAQKSPKKCAIADGEIEISYGVLESASNRFGRYLIELGCQKGDRVVLLAEKQALLLVGILGILKSGAIYTPLDPKMPVNRLKYILEDISPQVILTDEAFLSVIQENALEAAKVVLSDELRDLITEIEPDQIDILPELDSNDIAYCIHTSGSTGHPKGVLIKHGSVIDFFEGAREFYDVDENSRCVSFSPFNFDASVIDTLLPLYQGAWLYLYSDIIVPDLLFETINNNSITHFAAFGAMLGLITKASEFDSTTLTNLKTVLTGADVPDLKTVRKWLRKNEGVKVINGYGPTEATCACAAYIIRDIEPERHELYPIGKAFKHAKLYLVDSNGKIIYDPGIPGELLIGGTQVMKGYWNRDEENKARLLELYGIACYKTGDICKYLHDGNLFFIGRNDNEVNISGYRVNLNEIKRVINNIKEIEDSEILVMDTKYEEKILVAAIILTNNGNLHKDSESEVIQKRLSAELPNYMMPRQVAIMDNFPQMSSGKIDRKKLLSILAKDVIKSMEEK